MAVEDVLAVDSKERPIGLASANTSNSSAVIDDFLCGCSVMLGLLLVETEELELVDKECSLDLLVLSSESNKARMSLVDFGLDAELLSSFDSLGEGTDWVLAC